MPYGEEIFSPQRTPSLGYTADTVRQKFTGYERDAEIDLDFPMGENAFISAQIFKRHTGVFAN